MWESTLARLHFEFMLVSYCYVFVRHRGRETPPSGLTITLTVPLLVLTYFPTHSLLLLHTRPSFSCCSCDFFFNLVYRMIFKLSNEVVWTSTRVNVNNKSLQKWPRLCAWVSAWGPRCLSDNFIGKLSVDSYLTGNYFEVRSCVELRRWLGG